ncbi:MAG: SUMF1/EgtB/PvdO family nonheme iron enzyme, partial [Planctomycetota bacterium]
LRRLKAELGQRAQPAGNAAGDRPQDAALRAARRQVGELVDSAQALRNQRAESGLSESDKAEIDQQGLLAEYRLRETRLRVARLERWNFERPDDAWAYRMVEQLVVDLESLADPQTGLIAGSSARFGIGVKRRLAIAERIVSDSVTAHVELWKKRAAAVSESKHYTGLALKPQVGLVPLGPDPVTGLEEFAHVESGSLARRGDDGRLVFEDGTGMVFVLIPESRLSKRGLSTPPFVVVEPFFIAKYETTQGQWQQVSGQNPSTYQAGLSPQVGGGENTTLSLKSPVESISARDMEEFLRRLGLNLPTEAQWECAIGAPDAAGSHRVGKIQQPHLPVTETAMSARGVHGLMGNVSEVCRDPFAATIIPQRPGDGLRLAVLSDALTMRGLGLLEGDPKLGSKIRLPAPLEFRDPRLGFRAARKLAP